jgi:hypothetical protein
MEPVRDVIVEVNLKPNDVFTPFRWERANVIRWVTSGVLTLIFYDLFKSSSDALLSFSGGRSILDIVFVLVAFILLALLLFPYLRLLAFFRASPAIKKPRRLTFGTAGIKSESEDVTSYFKWSAIQRALETRGLFVLTQTKYTAIYVPKRCFASRDEIVRLREIIRDSLPGKWRLRRD